MRGEKAEGEMIPPPTIIPGSATARVETFESSEF